MENRETILIVEDEAIIAHHLQELLMKSGFNALVALDSASAYEQLTEEVDLALLDMNIEEKTSGLKLGNDLLSKYKIPFIYITANNEPSIMFKALETSPASYLTKPFNSIDVLASVKLALQRKVKSEKIVEIRDGSSVIRLKKAALKYALTDGNYIRLVTAEEEYLVRSTMPEMLEMLDSRDFYRTHRTAMVNIHFVVSYGLNHVSIDDVEIPLSRGHKKGFMEMMAQITRM